MAFSDIAERLRQELCLDATTEGDPRAYCLSETNRAAKELWETNDLVFALREQYFKLATDDPQITLPYYVGHVRGVRRPCFSGQNPIELNDMGPRYHYNSWGGISTMQWRIKHTTPLLRPITSAGPLRIKVGKPQANDVVFTLQGTTPYSQRTVEEVTLPAGEKSVDVPTVFTDITTIGKNVVTTCDCVVYSQIDDLPISAIPSHLTKARYLIINCYEDCCGNWRTPEYNTFHVEVLYKPLYFPFHFDGDEFQAEGYDEAIVQKVLANQERDPEKKHEILKSLGDLLRGRLEDFKRGQTSPVNQRRDAFLSAYEHLYENPYGISYGQVPRQ